MYMIWLGLVGFGLWHINHCGLLNAKPSLEIYLKYMISKHILYIIFLSEPELILFPTVKNGFTYFCLLPIIILTINHLFTDSLMFSSTAMHH